MTTHPAVMGGTPAHARHEGSDATGATARRAALAMYFVQIGGRLAMIAAAPLFGAATMGLVLQQDPAATVRQLALSIFGPSSSPVAGLALACVGGATAAWATPRVVRGRDGWLRHLPSSARDLHVGSLGALCVAQAPVALVFVGLAVVALASAPSFRVVNLLWVPCALAAMAVLVLPNSRRWLTLPLTVATLAGAFSGGWTRWGCGTALVFAAAACSAPIRPVRRQPSRSRLRWLPLPERIVVRALGWRAWFAYAWAVPTIAAAQLFRVNNGLDEASAASSARLGVGLAVTFVTAVLSERLTTARPAWPWSRSLPWGAGARVASDARFFLLATMPVLGVGAGLSGWTLLPACGVSLLTAAVAAAAVRRAPERRTGAAGEVLAFGGLAAASAAVTPWAAALCAMAAPLVLRTANEREQRQRVSRWLERHHLAAGDSLSWSGQ